MVRKLYHGSPVIVERPEFGYGKTYNNVAVLLTALFVLCGFDAYEKAAFPIQKRRPIQSDNM